MLKIRFKTEITRVKIEQGFPMLWSGKTTAGTYTSHNSPERARNFAAEREIENSQRPKQPLTFHQG